LDGRARRLWAAAESGAHGRGGISLVAYRLHPAPDTAVCDSVTFGLIFKVGI